jgi:Flp pilus assembly pilin Flp
MVAGVIACGFQERKMFARVTRFLADEEGLVTLEWVALASAVILLAVGAARVIRTSANSAASSVGSKVVSSVNSNS